MYFLIYRILLVLILTLSTKIKRKGTEMPTVKISLTMKQGDLSLLDINNHLKSEYTIKGKELINDFLYNSLELVLFEKFKLIRLSIDLIIYGLLL